MKKTETYRLLMGCPNCAANEELNIPKTVIIKDYVIPSERLCTNCGCRLDGKVTPAPKPEPETAFQGMVRTALAHVNGKKFPDTDFIDPVKYPWERLLSRQASSIEALRTFRNATLELAKKASWPGASRDAIQALKEPLP